MNRLSVLGALLPLLFACAELPAIGSNECGNAVVEPGEDCDTFAPNPSSSCRPRGTPGECHLDCARRGNGTRPACPSGWGCDPDSICRAPTGQFATATAQVGAGAWAISAADFDGDGRTDLMSREPLDAIGATRLTFQYFDGNGQLAQNVSFPKLLLSPAVADLSHDGRADVAFSDGRVGLMLGRADRSWVPETFSTYQLPDPNVRMLGLYKGPVNNVSALVAFASLGGDTAIYLPDPQTGVLGKRATVSVRTDQLVGDPVSGDVIEDAQRAPCWEAAWAARGASRFTLANPCVAGSNGAPAWRDQFEQVEVPLEPPAAIDSAPLLADVNGDGHLDVLVGAAGATYVAYGDGQTLANAVPFALDLANSDAISPNIPMPLAAGDFSGDGLVDFVFADYLLISTRTPNGTLPTYVADHLNSLTAPWTVAKIGDLNHDGSVDVAVASRGSLNIELFNGNGSEHLVETTLSTGGPVKSLDMGDFDGDQINDLVFIEQDIGDDADALKIAFGPVSTALTSQVAPATTVARVRNSSQLTVYRENAFGNMVVSSSQVIDGTLNGVLTLLDGSGDRIPFSPFPLSSFASTGSVGSAIGLALSAGSFQAPGSSDILALATSNLVDLELWLGSSVDSALVVPVRLTLTLDPRLSPIKVSGVDLSSIVASAAADLDGDGRDEAVFVMPAGADQAQCGVLVIGAGANTGALPAPREPLILDFACPDAQPLLVDVDADGFRDLALLSGTVSAGDRRIWVFWNDGAGGFSTSSVTRFPDGGTRMRALSALPAAAGIPFRFAYASDASVELVSLLAGSRELGSPELLAPLANATGIAAADVNGDGVPDLALAASGKLSVMKAELATP